MSRSLLKLSQSYATGELDQQAYREQRRQAILENLADGDDQTKPGGLQPPVQEPAQPPAQAPAQVLPQESVQFQPPNKPRVLASVLLVAGLAIAAVAINIALNPVIEQQQSPLAERFDQISNDGDIDPDEHEGFFELWEQSPLEAQQQWIATASAEQREYADTSDDTQLSRNENIDSLLVDIQNQPADNVSDQHFDVRPAKAEPAVEKIIVKQAIVKKEIVKKAIVKKEIVKEIIAEKPIEKVIVQTAIVEAPVDEVAEPVVIKSKPAPKKRPIISVTEAKYHKVKPGENVFALSQKYNVLVDALTLMNPGIDSGIKADSTVIIGGIVKHTIASGETLTGIARQYKMAKAKLIEFNPGIDQKFMAGAKVIIKKVIINKAVAESDVAKNAVAKNAVAKKTEPTNDQGLAMAFDRLAADQQLSVANLKSFYQQWKQSDKASKRQLLEFDQFTELYDRLQLEVTHMKQGRKKRNSNEEKWVKKVARKFVDVKRAKG